MAATTRATPAAMSRSVHGPVTAGLERDIERGAAGLLAGLLESHDFRVTPPGPSVVAAPDNLAARDEHRSHGRIRAGASGAAARQLERFFHELRHYASNNDATNFSGSNGSKSSNFSPTPT
jgi:hypothetical protein